MYSLYNHIQNKIMYNSSHHNKSYQLKHSHRAGTVIEDKCVNHLHSNSSLKPQRYEIDIIFLFKMD